MANIKTVDEHIFYLEETVKLSLWVVANWKNKHRFEKFIHAIDRTPLLNHTVFNDNHIMVKPSVIDNRWIELRKELKKVYLNYRDPFEFEKKGFELLKPFIKGRVERDMIDLADINPDEDESWLRYNVKKKSKHMEIHMENALYPNSFLADKKYFYSKLEEAVLDAEEHGFKILWSQSWLNTYPVWQKLMPKEWNDSICKINHNIEWHLGFWGQFLRSNETFNIKNGEIFRSTGKIPYPMAYAEAPLTAFKELLKVFPK